MRHRYLTTMPPAEALGRWLSRIQVSIEVEEIPVERFRVVLNRHQKRSLITDGEIEKTLGQKIFWKVPNQYAQVVKAINGGEPIAQLSTSEVAKNLTELAVQLGAKPAVSDKKKESTGFRGFLGR